MRKARLIIALISGIILIAALIMIDYKIFIDRSNLAMFLLVITSVLNIVAMIASNRHEKKQQLKSSDPPD